MNEDKEEDVDEEMVKVTEVAEDFINETAEEEEATSLEEDLSPEEAISPEEATSPKEAISLVDGEMIVELVKAEEAEVGVAGPAELAQVPPWTRSPVTPRPR